MREILIEQMEKLNISKTERQILLEDFEVPEEIFEENFIEKHSKKPTKKDKLAFVKEYLKDHAMVEKPHERQSKKEEEQIDCILRALKRGKKRLNAEEMADLLRKEFHKAGTSVKTVYRRIIPDLLEHDVKKGADHKYYYDSTNRYISEQSKKIEENELSSDDRIEAIAMISKFLETIKDSPVYEKGKKFLKEETVKTSYRSLKDIDSEYTRVIFLGAPESNIRKETWDIIYKAMNEKRLLNLHYVPEGKKDKIIYKVRPYQLIFDNGMWELWAECLKQKHEGKRLFNLSRIANVEVLDLAGKFSLPDDYDFLQIASGNFGCYYDGIPIRYKLLFSKDSYAWLYTKDRIWGDNQSIRETSKGYVLSFEAAQFKPILRWVLGWGDEVTPIEPKELVEEWKGKIKKMSQSL
ncbi:MAG: WYL domain-containing protein [Treponema sp.]|nr:WYL domain-containing protein [Treponema sp.]